MPTEGCQEKSYKEENVGDKNWETNKDKHPENMGNKTEVGEQNMPSFTLLVVKTGMTS